MQISIGVYVFNAAAVAAASLKKPLMSTDREKVATVPNITVYRYINFAIDQQRTNKMLYIVYIMAKQIR